MQEYHILIVEDDTGLNQGIAMALAGENMRFFTAGSLKEARELWQRESIDMVLLDINLPDGSGYELLREIRREADTPVLMITANDMEVDEVTGFSLGADDYITKPFSLMVLRARVERMRRRSRQDTGDMAYRDRDYEFHFDEMRFWAGGREVTLSKTEQKLLRLFTANPGQTLARERLMALVWPDGADYVDENALSVAVNRLRKKLDCKQADNPIQTVYGLGYVWERKNY